jgi:crotonobetainyl-CoA hydratase
VTAGLIPSPPKVLVERVDRVVVLTINRPEVRNAVDSDVSRLLGSAVADADSDRGVRAIVLTGSGSLSFCAGADLRAIARGETLTAPGRPEWSFAGFVRQLTDKPTIAAVNGDALGGGTELVLACDLAVSTKSARFGLPEVSRGLIPGGGGAVRLPHQVPHKVALDLLLTGRLMPAEEALRWGLVNQVVADGGALEAGVELAQVIARNAPLAVQAAKRVALGRSPEGSSPEDHRWALSDSEFASVLASADAQEGPRAFAERRQPEWAMP